MLFVRCWCVEDLPVLANIAKASMSYAWPLRVFEDAYKAGYFGWICEVENQVVGFAVALLGVDEVQLMDLVVLPAFRRQGHAKRLLNEIDALAKRAMKPQIWLEVRQSNDAAIALYKSSGFVVEGLRRNYYPTEAGREDALQMTKTIPESGWS